MAASMSWGLGISVYILFLSLFLNLSEVISYFILKILNYNGIFLNKMRNLVEQVLIYTMVMNTRKEKKIYLGEGELNLRCIIEKSTPVILVGIELWVRIFP